jgi:hypothetical protein
MYRGTKTKKSMWYGNSGTGTKTDRPCRATVVERDTEKQVVQKYYSGAGTEKNMFLTGSGILFYTETETGTVQI